MHRGQALQKAIGEIAAIARLQGARKPMTRLNAALRDVIEDLRVRWIMAKARARAGARHAARGSSRPASVAGTTSELRSSGNIATNHNRDEQLQWSIRKAADVIESLSGEPVAFVILMQPVGEGGSFQAVSNIGKGKTIEMLLHSARGLMSGSAQDVKPPRAN
jgi:hypothetical protein